MAQLLYVGGLGYTIATEGFGTKYKCFVSADGEITVFSISTEGSENR